MYGVFFLTTATKIPEFYELSTKEDGSKHLDINPHPGQEKVLFDPARIVVLLCGSQYGKTTLGPVWLHQEMQKRGPGDYLIVTATFPLLRNKLLPELLKYFGHHLNWGEWKAAERVYESHEKINGAPAYRIIVGSATSPESLESATAKAAWLDEAGQNQFTREAWEAVNRRVAVNQGRILITTTPYEFNWFKTEIYDRWVDGDMDISVIQGDSTDNPAFPRAEYERQKGLLPLWKFNMFYRGLFTKPAGMIYDAFDDNVCLIDRSWRIPPSNYRCYVGHDFGPNNTAAVWFAVDPDTGYIFIYRTYHEGGLSHFDHVQKWKELSQGENIVKRVGGALAEDGQREACAAAGWPISKPRERSVEAGIMATYGWFQQSKVFIFKDLTDLTDELLSYSYELDDKYEVKQPTTIKDKASFHKMDCLRYFFVDMGPERIPGSEKAMVVDHSDSAIAQTVETNLFLAPSIRARLAKRNSETAGVVHHG